MKKGAYNYLTKPLNPGIFLFSGRKGAGKALSQLGDRKAEKSFWRKGMTLPTSWAGGQKMQEVLEIVSRIAKTESTVYIHGESGTGKELIAKAIHLASDRKNKPFVAHQLCRSAETLLVRGQLFGHEKGLLPRAVRSTKGLFTQAHEGTIFLDEIGDYAAAHSGQAPPGAAGAAVLSPGRRKTG